MINGIGTGSNPFCGEFACSPRVCVGSLRLSVSVGVSVVVCLVCLCGPVMDW